MTLVLFILGFVLGAGAIVFALQNNEIVALTFLSWQFESTVALLVIASVAVGILIGLLAVVPSVFSSSLRIMGLKKDNRKLVDEIVARDNAERLAVTNPPLDIRQQ